MPKYKGCIKLAKADCRTKPCSVPGCVSLRNGISQYCKKHEYASRYWGNPLAGSLRLHEFQAAITQAAELLKKNADHPGVNHCIEFLQRYLNAAGQGSTIVPGHQRIAALYDAGVSGLELLARVAAVYLMRESNRHLILGDTHALFLVGHLVLRSRTVSGLPQVLGRERKAVGKFIVSAIGTLCVNLSTSLREKQLLQERSRNDMSKPLHL